MFRCEIFLLTFRSWHKEERHNLRCCLIHLAPISSGPHRAQVRLAFASSNSLNFLWILTQTSARFRCVTSPAPCHSVSSRTIVTSEWQVRSVHAHALPLASRLHQTNHVLSQKVLRRTKPKGYYITCALDDGERVLKYKLQKRKKKIMSFNLSWK